MPAFDYTVATHNAAGGGEHFTYAPLADLIDWQEVKGRAARRRLRKALPGYSHWFAGELATSVRKSKFTVRRRRVRRTMRGIARVVPGKPLVRADKIVDGIAKLGPDRYQLTVPVRPKVKPFRRVTIRNINGHLTNGVQKRKPPIRWRERSWRKGAHALSSAARTPAKSLRIRAVVNACADLNMKVWDCIPGLVDVRHNDAAKPGYDRVMYRRDPRLSVLNAHRGPRRGSDHAPIVVRFQITHPKEK